MLQLQDGGWIGISSLRPSRMQARQGQYAKEEAAEGAQDHNGKGVLFQSHHPRPLLRGGATQQHTARAVAPATLSCKRPVPPLWGKISALPPLKHNQQQAPSQVSSGP
jgi:hypothetical protein